MAKIYAVGESILDIMFRDGQVEASRPGGSSFNTAISLGRLGLPVSFFSETGMDQVGDMIRDFLESNGVDATGLYRFTEGQSAIALAFLDSKSDATYQFFKAYPEKRLDVAYPDFHPGDLLMFGSFFALESGIRPRIKSLLDKALGEGATLVYDPNFRASHKEDRDRLLSVIRENMSMAHLVRASNEDLENIFGVKGPDQAWEVLGKLCPVMVYTTGGREVHLRSQNLAFSLEVEEIEPLSTIGAGDTFNAGIIYGLYRGGYGREQIPELGREQWTEILNWAMVFSREVCMSYDNYLPEELAGRYRI